MTKQFYTFTLAVVFTPMLEFLEKYAFCDWEFLRFLVILMVFDTITGIIKYWKHKQISSSAFGRILMKIISYMSVLILAHVLSHFTIEGESIGLFSWADNLAYSALLVKEAISILENLGAINPKWVPTWLLKRLKEFDTNGQFKKS